MIFIHNIGTKNRLTNMVSHTEWLKMWKKTVAYRRQYENLAYREASIDNKT